MRNRISTFNDSVHSRDLSQLFLAAFFNENLSSEILESAEKIFNRQQGTGTVTENEFFF